MADENPNPEQLKALQEKIKNMSPEELKDFQKKQCIFCQIISGKIQAKKIYEDEKVVGILDINPGNPGHTLVMTKEHYSIMPQLPDEDVADVFLVVKALSNTMLRSIDAQGTNIIVANGIAAGQRAQHFMVHLIPRKENDGINFVLPQKTLNENEIEMIGNKLAAALGGSVEKEEKQLAPQLAPLPEKKSNEIKIQKEVHPRKSKYHDKDNTEINEPKTGINLDDISKILGVK
ncbi:MAG TPA: HIT domain-containing protein [Candidatus Nanoarchaeia archaeon]|nr:HIT domain-containing protein [Candidatus Nanoarchaeia archaeon]